MKSIWVSFQRGESTSTRSPTALFNPIPVRIGRLIAFAVTAVLAFSGVDSIPTQLDVIGAGPAYGQGFGAGRSRDSLFRESGARDRSRGRSNRREQEPQLLEEYEPGQDPLQQPLEREVPQGEVEAPERPEPAPPAQPQARAPIPRRPDGVRPPIPGRRLPPGRPPSGDAPGQTEEPTAGIPPEGHLVMRLVPLEQAAEIGEEFAAHVWIDNPEKKKFNVVSLALSFDPSLLEFIDAPGGAPGAPNSFDLSEKTTSAFELVRDPSEDPFYLNWADTKNGMIYYRARSASGEFCESEGFLLTMKFKALAPIHRTGLRFQFSEWSEDLEPPVQSDQSWSWPKTMTFVGMAGEESGWENRLGGTSKLDGVISALVSLTGPDKETLLDAQLSAPEGITRTRIYLDPPVVVSQVGETFDLGVHLENPDRVPWDRIRLDIRFDPRVLEVVDQDEGNWLTLGTNILDGPYHDRFPFDFPRDNQVRADSGRILYDAAVFRRPIHSGGLLASIRFKAIAPAGETRIAFAFPKDRDDRRGTALIFRGADVLENTDLAQDGAYGVIALLVPAKDRQFLSAKTGAVAGGAQNEE